MVAKPQKLVVVDGDAAFTGGLSIDDVFLGERPGADWRETMIEIEGPVIGDIAQTFAAEWRITTNESIEVEGKGFIEHVHDADAQFVVSTRSAPCIETCLAHSVRSATARVFATTPYFVPHGVIANELKAAAERGVDVRVLIPGDHHTVPLVKAASRGSSGRCFRAASVSSNTARRWCTRKRWSSMANLTLSSLREHATEAASRRRRTSDAVLSAAWERARRAKRINGGVRVEGEPLKLQGCLSRMRRARLLPARVPLRH